MSNLRKIATPKVILMAAFMFAMYGLIVVVTAGLLVQGCGGGLPKIVDEADLPPQEKLNETDPPVQFFTENSIIKFKKNCYKLVPGDGVLTVHEIECP